MPLPPALIGQRPATEARQSAENACQGDCPERHRGSGPFRNSDASNRQRPAPSWAPETAERLALMPRRRQPATDAASTTDPTRMSRSQSSPRATTSRPPPASSRSRYEARVGQRSNVQPPLEPAQEHPVQPRRCPAPPGAKATGRTDFGSQLASDLELPFQRGEADLVGKLGKHHHASSRRLGSLCEAQVASTTGLRPLPLETATSMSTTAPAATCLARTATRHQGPRKTRGRLPR